MVTPTKKHSEPRSSIWAFFNNWKVWESHMLPATKKNQVGCTAAFYWRKCKIEKVTCFFNKEKKCEEWIKITLL